MFLATLVLLALTQHPAPAAQYLLDLAGPGATDCSIASHAAVAKRQRECIARELAASRPFFARYDVASGSYPLTTVAYAGNRGGTVYVVTRDEQGKFAKNVIYTPQGAWPLRVGGIVTSPVLAEETRRRVDNPHDIRGLIILDATIDRDGRVTETHVLKALPYGLDKAAEAAVRSLRLQPGRFFGQPAPVLWNVTIRVSEDELIIPATPPR